MKVLSRSQAEKLFAKGAMRPQEIAETARIKAERRQRARTKRYTPVSWSETTCMGSGRRSHWPYRDAHAEPGECRSVEITAEIRKLYEA